MTERPFLNKDYSNCESFNDMGEPLIIDEDNKFTVRAGQIFEAKTKKGGKNLIVAMRVVDRWMVYIHGDKAKKCHVDEFHRAVLNGDIEPKKPSEIDAGRMSMAMIGIDAIANRRTAEESIMCAEEGAMRRHMEQT